MSELIDRLRAASGAAGSAAGDRLASTETVDVMAARVRAGVRRRRVVAGGVGGAVAAIAAVALIVVPPLVSTVPEASVDPAGRSILHADGPLTVYDDGSISVVTNSGRIVDVAPVDGTPPGLVPRTKEQECHFVPTEVELGWTWQRDEYQQRLITFGTANIVDGDDWDVVQQGQQIPISHERAVGFELVVDPAIADSLVIQHTVVDLYEGLPISIAMALTAAPDVVAAADGAAASDNVAVLHSSVLDSMDLRDCGRPMQTPVTAETVRVDTYIVADVWLTDRAGTAVLVGTHVTRAYSEVEVG